MTSPLVRGLLAGIPALLGSCILPPSTGLANEGSTAPGLTAPASFRVAPYGGRPRPDREKHLLISYDRGVVVSVVVGCVVLAGAGVLVRRRLRLRRR
ncbi:hypothetical protein [Streptomyces sp. NPDC048669]|uniref:hypothetical protein n=1 Tax=Streptomyces sp. NPDC048669 TaxID=3155267 RepID=UPI00342B93CD